MPELLVRMSAAELTDRIALAELESQERAAAQARQKAMRR